MQAACDTLGPVATALITIDQPTHSTTPKGPVGRARKDLELGKAVVVRNTDNTDVTRWRWQLRDKPIGSTATISDPTAAQVTFTPDVEGSYRLTLSINDGGVGAIDTKIAAVETADGLRYPATGEQASEVNWLILGSTNTKGWGKDGEELWRKGVAPSSLAAVLSNDNKTGGTNIEVTNGDSIYFADADEGTEGGLGYDHATDELLLRADSDTRVRVGPLEVYPSTNNATDLGKVGNSWKDGHFEGDVTVGNLITTGQVDGRDVSDDGDTLDNHLLNTTNPHGTTLAQVLAEGTTTGPNSIRVDNGQSLVGEDGGSISFEPTSGLIKMSATCVGDPGTEPGEITIDGAGVTSTFQISTIGGSQAGLILHRHSTAQAPLIITARSRSNDDTHTIVDDGDGLFQLYALGWDGVDYAFGGYLGFQVSGTPGSNDMPTRFVVSVSPDGSQTLTERLEISPSGAAKITGSLTVTKTLTVTETLSVTGQDYSIVRGSTARGSTNTRIYRWTSQVASAGSAITYSDSAANGGSWLVSSAGIYSVSVSQEAGAATQVAIKAAASLSNTFDETSIKAVVSASVGTVQTLHWTGPLAANDRIWVSVAATSDPSGTSANYRTVTVTRIH